MNKISIKTAYYQMKNLSAMGKAFPSKGADFLIQSVKPLLVGKKIEQILNTSIWDWHCSINSDHVLQQSMADEIEWHGPFVFVIDNQYLSVLFTAPQHYEIGLNSLCLEDIVSIEKRSFAEIQKLKSENQFLDISFLYPQIIGTEIDDIEIIQDETKDYPTLLAVLIRLHNGLYLTVSEEIDNPMLRVFSNKQEAKKTIRTE